MHYVNIIDSASPDDFFMFMSSRINVFNIQRNNRWTLCKINNNELTVKVLSAYLSEYIWEISLPRLCLKYLNRYFKVPVSSKFDIVSQAMNVASCLKENTVDIVEEKLNEYLDSEHGYLTVDGFIAFRLQGLVDDIKALLNITVYENNLETEYNDFISFMKEIVSEQLPAYDEIFLLEDKNGFKILSDDGTDITLDYSGNDCKCCFFNSESELDSVLSSVIYIAPRRIYIHCSDEMFISSFCELIKGIFPGKVIKC